MVQSGNIYADLHKNRLDRRVIVLYKGGRWSTVLSNRGVISYIRNDRLQDVSRFKFVKSKSLRNAAKRVF
jgi:hypothetical protein